VSAALAWLLAESEADRNALQKEAQTLYDDRSKIVHGGSEPDFEAARSKHERALILVIRSLRRLLADLPELVADKQRGKKLLLGYGINGEGDTPVPGQEEHRA
jgi:hypothetical protein